MTTVIGVSFKRAGKMYYFDPNGMEMHIGDQVIVETARGMECGDVVTEIREVEDEEVVSEAVVVLVALAVVAEAVLVAEVLEAVGSTMI